MGTFWPNNRLLTQAFAASLMLHVLIATVIPAMTWSPSATTIETISFVHLMHITVATPKPKIRQVAATAPHRAPAAHLAPIVHVRPRLVNLKRPRVLALPTAKAAAAPFVAAAQPGGTTQQRGEPSTPAAPVTAPPQQEVANATKHDMGGYAPLGENEPNPVLDPAVYKALAKLAVHVTLIVTVGPDGKTESIDFQPPIDVSIENQIRTMLANASWDPAQCGVGVACEGRATIKL
jgi:hypothetical protein